MNVSEICRHWKRKTKFLVSITNVPACMHVCAFLVGKEDVENKYITIISIMLHKGNNQNYIFFSIFTIYICICPLVSIQRRHKNSAIQRICEEFL